MSALPPLASGSVSLRLYPHDGLAASDIVAELRVQASLAADAFEAGLRAIDVALADTVRSAEVPVLPMVVDRLLSPGEGTNAEGRLAEAFTVLSTV